jgi:hypothetical protein
MKMRISAVYPKFVRSRKWKLFLSFWDIGDYIVIRMCEIRFSFEGRQTRSRSI